MDWKQNCKGFALQKGYLDWEAQALSIFCVINNIPFLRVHNKQKIPENWIPSGTVKWIESILDNTIPPDYFPKFLRQNWIKRKIWYQEKWPKEKVFIKPANKHKLFDGFIISGKWGERKQGPFWCSEIVDFKHEWRYYISYGEIIGGYWYQGKNEEDQKEAPDLKINYPIDWCGTADFGELTDGTIELIECHPPMACGWYGKRHEEYAKFLTLGWQWLKNKEYIKYINDRF